VLAVREGECRDVGVHRRRQDADGEIAFRDEALDRRAVAGVEIDGSASLVARHTFGGLAGFHVGHRDQ